MGLAEPRLTKDVIAAFYAAGLIRHGAPRAATGSRISSADRRTITDVRGAPSLR
jgi:hypothetical protein